ncbi:MAG: GNAT family N-acetyltransferase [Candidatus Lokiarchaeota archaeon]|nr:GNAT family N-acetyltransferase [Candidatus Lokiarchaeota archaeon]
MMQNHGISSLEIDVFVWNEEAIKFYEKLGFTKRCYQMRLSSSSKRQD